MSDVRLFVDQQKNIPLPLERLYSIINDYESENGHKAIIPPAYFSDLRCERRNGERHISFFFHLMGQKQQTQGVISERVEGETKIIEERYSDRAMSTQFHLTPLNEQQTSVTISTSWFAAKGGLLGKIEGWLLRPFFRKVYREELQRLQDVAERP